MSAPKLKWLIRLERIYPPEQWALGIGLSRWGEETYLYINLIFRTVSIGKMYLEVEEC